MTFNSETCKEQICERAEVFSSMGCKTSFDSLLARKGVTCHVLKLSECEQLYIDWILGNMGGPQEMEANQCYANAQKLMMFDTMRKLRYFEGYFMSDFTIIPVLHAWVMFGEKVVDFTPARNREKHGDELSGGTVFSYFGMELPRLKVSELIFKNKRHGCMLEDLQMAGVDLEKV